LFQPHAPQAGGSGADRQNLPVANSLGMEFTRAASKSRAVAPWLHLLRTPGGTAATEEPDASRGTQVTEANMSIWLETLLIVSGMLAVCALLAAGIAFLLIRAYSLLATAVCVPSAAKALRRRRPQKRCAGGAVWRLVSGRVAPTA
jgi:hypothetical protein